MADKSGEAPTNSYFRVANPILMGIIGFGLYLLTMATFSPKDIPVILGPVGRFGRFIGETYPNLCYGISVMALIAHVGEAVYSYKLCRDRRLNTSSTCKWVIQTFLFGFGSLLKLVPYKPKSN